MTIDLRTPDAIKEIDIVCGSRRLSGRLAAPANGKPRGLIIALHGGSYTSRYFDTPGHSVLSAIAQLGYTVIGIDRPGYGAAKDWPLDFDSQVAELVPTIERLWREYGQNSGVFIYGHSIGGMIGLLIAAASRKFPLLGISMTGSGAVMREQARAAFTGPSQSSDSHIRLPHEAKIGLMFGPEWTYDKDVAAADPYRDVPLATAELRDALAWQQRLPTIAKKADVPVQFIVGEFDGIWHADRLDGLPALFERAPFVDVYCQRQSGHDCELDHLGYAQALKVVAFAEECRLHHSREVA